MKTYKRFTLLTLAVCVAAMLFGCKSNSPTETTGIPPKEPVVTKTTAPATVPETEPEETTLPWPLIDPADMKNELIAGTWVHPEGVSLEFDGIENFVFSVLEDPDDTVEGLYCFDGSFLWMRDKNGEILSAYILEDGGLYVDNSEVPFVLQPEKPVLDLGLVDKWTYNFEEVTLEFKPDGTFAYADRSGSGNGLYTFDGTNLELMEEDGQLFDTGTLESDGRLYINKFPGWFYTKDGISYAPLKDPDVIAPQRDAHSQVVSLDDSVAFYDDDYYELTDADWIVNMTDAIETSDGMKEFSFIVSYCIPYSEVPDRDAMMYTSGLYTLYDRYTGLILTPMDYFNTEGAVTTARNYYFDSKDGRVHLGYASKVEATGAASGYFNIVTVTYTFGIPTWYDGLTLAIHPGVESRENLDSIENLSGSPFGRNVFLSSTPIEEAVRFSLNPDME